MLILDVNNLNILMCYNLIWVDEIEFFTFES